MEVDTSVPIPLPPQLLRFVDAYCACRDVSKAALEAGFAAKDGMGLYRRKPVFEEITRRMAPVEHEVAVRLAKKRVINVEMLDANLKQVITIPRKLLEATPSLATPKVNAIEMGYKRAGLLIDYNFVPDASSGPTKEEAPRIYRPAEQTIITHQITETRQVVTNRQAGADAETIRARVRAMTMPQTIDAEVETDPDDDPWKNF
jgi:hypothetical protein